jgi:hypothetical protein
MQARDDNVSLAVEIVVFGQGQGYRLSFKMWIEEQALENEDTSLVSNPERSIVVHLFVLGCQYLALQSNYCIEGVDRDRRPCLSSAEAKDTGDEGSRCCTENRVERRIFLNCG